MGVLAAASGEKYTDRGAYLFCIAEREPGRISWSPTEHKAVRLLRGTPGSEFTLRKHQRLRGTR